MSPAVEREPFTFEIRAGEPLRGDAWRPTRPEPGAAVIVCHGFKGFKDWGFFPYVGRELARRTGCAVVTFNFTGSGVGESAEEFTDPESFARNTFGRELEDLEAVMDRLAAGQAGGVPLPPAGRFGLLGHSRGGATALLKAAARSQVRALVTWSSIADVERYGQMYRDEWEAGRTVYIENKRTGQRMPLERNVLDDVRANRDRRDLEAAARTLRIPYLILHARDDESVPPADAEVLARAAGERGTLRWIEEGGHTLGVGHPFGGPSEPLEEALALTADHLRAGLLARVT